MWLISSETYTGTKIKYETRVQCQKAERLNIRT